MPEQKLRAHLGSFGVTGNLALQPMYTLSGILPFLSSYFIDTLYCLFNDVIELGFDFCLNRVFALFIGFKARHK